MNTNDLSAAMAAVKCAQASDPSVHPSNQFLTSTKGAASAGNLELPRRSTFGIGGVATRSHSTSRQADGSQLFNLTGSAKATGLWYLAVVNGWMEEWSTYSLLRLYERFWALRNARVRGRNVDTNGFGEMQHGLLCWTIQT